MFNELFWPAGAVLLLFWMAYREATISGFKLRIQGLQKSSRIYMEMATIANKKYEALVKESNLKELEAGKEIIQLKDSLEQIINRMINSPKEKLQSTPEDLSEKKISPNQ